MTTTMHRQPQLVVSRPPKADVAIGVLAGLLAAANLVQGAWLQAFPILDLTNIAFVLLLPVVITQVARTREFHDLHLLALMIAMVVLGYRAASLNPAAVEKRLEIVPGVLFAVIAGYFLLSNPIRIRAFAATVVVQAFAVLAALIVSPDDSYYPGSGRLSPLGSNPISSGRLLAAGGLVLVCASLHRFRSRRSFLAIALALPLLVGAGATGSRGPVAAALVAALILILRLRQLSVLAKACLLLTGFVAARLVGLYLANDGSRLTDLSDPAREGLLVESMKLAANHPWGVGWGNLYNYFPAWANLAEQGYKQYPHNVLMEFTVEGGWLAGFLFALFAVAVLRKAWCLALHSSTRVLSALFIVSLVSALFSSDVVGNRMMWVVAGALCGMARHYSLSPDSRGDSASGKVV